MSEVFCIFSKLLLRGCENNTLITPSGFLSLVLFIILLQWISNFYLCFSGEEFVVCSCLDAQHQQNPLEGLFPGSKDMFIFALEIASLFTFLFPSLCFLGFHNNTKTLSIVPQYSYFVSPLPPFLFFWINLQMSINWNKEWEELLVRHSQVRITSCDQRCFFQGTCLQSSHFPCVFSPYYSTEIYHSNPISSQESWEELPAPLGAVAGGDGSGHTQELQEHLGSVRSFPALESGLAFTGCTFWQCLLIKKA